MALAGGFSADKPADDEIRAIFEVDTVRASVGGLLGLEVATLVVVSYQTQVVCTRGVGLPSRRPL